MPRGPRVLGESGYYHIIARGIGKQILFEEPNDFVHMLHLINRFGIETNVKINAYCLMENHFHLLVYDIEHNTPLFMKKLAGTYAAYFNRKYGRTGHLFQDRYISKNIECEDTLLTVFRYILNNPREAAICNASEYAWSSYKKYGNPNSFVDTMILQELLGSFEEYAAYIDAKYEDDDTEIEDRAHDDEWAKSVIRKFLKIESGTALQTFDRKTRNDSIKLLKEKGLSVRQIERLTGISKSVIQRI